MFVLQSEAPPPHACMHVIIIKVKHLFVIHEPDNEVNNIFCVVDDAVFKFAHQITKEIHTQKCLDYFVYIYIHVRK